MFSGSAKQLRNLLGEAISGAPQRQESARGIVSVMRDALLDRERCKKAGISESQKDQLTTLLFLTSASILLVTLLTLKFPLLFFMVLPPFLTRIYISSKIAVRVSSFDKDFAALLLSLASSLKAGVDATSALERSVELFPENSVMHEELVEFVRMLASGKREEDAIRDFARSVDHPDIELFRRSFLLSRKQGGSLSMCLQRLARFTRQRQSFRRKVSAALAMQKLSAIGIGGCALLIVFIQLVSQPDALFTAFANPLGFRMLTLGGLLILLGLGLMLRLATKGAGGRV